MTKIPTLFQRNHDTDRLVRDEVTPCAEWVIAGEGMATRKFDGTSCLFKGGRWFKRYDAKHGKTPPVEFIPAQESADPVTGHWPGWLPVIPADKWHNEAIKLGMAATGLVAGSFAQMVEFKNGRSYELVGPKIQSNPENALIHVMVEHGQRQVIIHRLTFLDIRATLQQLNIEGVVWHHPDGRMAKIKLKDFGLKRRV